jgi:hypothetical protein
MENAQQPGEEAVAREEEDDYDLLTFGEAGARLDQEIKTLAREVERLRGLVAAGEAEQAELKATEDRLELLRGAASRNARQPINDENFQKFFGYEGKARRNTA